MGRDHLFLGSRLGNSLLLKCSKKTWDKSQSLIQEKGERKGRGVGREGVLGGKGCWKGRRKGGRVIDGVDNMAESVYVLLFR